MVKANLICPFPISNSSSKGLQPTADSNDAQTSEKEKDVPDLPDINDLPPPPPEMLEAIDQPEYFSKHPFPPTAEPVKSQVDQNKPEETDSLEVEPPPEYEETTPSATQTTQPMQTIQTMQTIQPQTISKAAPPVKQERCCIGYQ
jgi:hypothetical protein